MNSDDYQEMIDQTDVLEKVSDQHEDSALSIIASEIADPGSTGCGSTEIPWFLLPEN